MARATQTRAPSRDWESDVRRFTLSSKWLYDQDSRLDATAYAEGALRALSELEACPYPKRPFGKLCGTIWHPVQNQARSNFKRIYTKPEHGVPFVSSRDMFFLPLRPERFLSRRMPKLGDLMVPEGWILLSRSGTVGNVLLVSRTLSSCAISDHAIRIEPRDAPAGYLYAFLASGFGQPLIAKGTYGATVDELEPKHIADMPVPLLPERQRQRIHDGIAAAYRLRDEANDLLGRVDADLHALLGVSPFSDEDVEYLGGPDGPRSFVVTSSEIGDRPDAANHVPIVRSLLHKLERGRFPLTPLGKMCAEIRIPGRFKRQYTEAAHGVPYLLPSQLPVMRPYGMKAVARAQAEKSPEFTLRSGQLLVTTDGTVGRVHPVTPRMDGWFGSNNMARLSDNRTDMGFLYAFLATPFGFHQLRKDIYGGVVDHLNESHIAEVLVPDGSPDEQRRIGDLVRLAFAKKDEANALEDRAIAELEAGIRGEVLEPERPVRLAEVPEQDEASEREGRLSMYPVDPRAALRAFMQVDPKRVAEREREERERLKRLKPPRDKD